jgi:serine/threonine-protein kinase
MRQTPAQPSRVGEVLAEKYQITRFIGEGGMGTVYEAQHAIVGRRFAVKYLRAELAGEEETLERFRREARAAGALENENIVSVVDFGVAGDGIPYMVMEYLVGEDLASLLGREGPMPIARAVNLVIQVCRGLDAAHAAGIIHRDLKPENLFVGRRGDGTDLVKILDFGIAKLSEAGMLGPMTPVTRSGATMGTPFYMPPEQARGAKTIDHRADIYSLGVILFEALSGERPHPGQSYNEILYHILTQPPVPLDSLRAGLHPDLVGTVHQAIAFDPQDRPPSAAQLARALAPHAGRQITPLRSQFDLQVTRQSAGPSTAEPAVGEAATTGAKAKAHSRRWALAVGGLAIAAAAAWAMVGHRSSSVSGAKAVVPVVTAETAAVPVIPTSGVATIDARPAEPAVAPAARPAADAGASKATILQGSPGAHPKASKRALPARPSPSAAPPSAPAGPQFDERNPYQ